LAAADLRLAAAVVSVAKLALIAIDFSTGSHVRAVPGAVERVSHRAIFGGDGAAQQPLSDRDFGSGRVCARARPFPEDPTMRAGVALNVYLSRLLYRRFLKTV
jgi:hypothetical protein